MEFLCGSVVADQIFKNRENVLSVLNHFFQNGAQFRRPGCFLVPLRQHGRWNLNIAPKFIGGVATQKETIKKRRFTLRELKILQRFFYRVGNRSHRRNRSLPISIATSSRHARKSKYIDA